MIAADVTSDDDAVVLFLHPKVADAVPGVEDGHLTGTPWRCVC